MTKKRKAYNKSTGRDYSYDTAYQASPEQKKRRAARNRARDMMEKAGKVRKGDMKDVDHKSFSPDMNDKMSELQVLSRGKNRGKKPPRLRKK
jgi:hypothetical protein